LTDETNLLETFDKFREALFCNDVEMLNLLIAEEYVGFDPLGNTQDKNMSLDGYRAGATKLDKYDVEEVTSVVLGVVGIITGKGYIRGHFAESDFEHNLRFLDLYVHRDGRYNFACSWRPLPGRRARPQLMPALGRL
jgi:hypothetical protein